MVLLDTCALIWYTLDSEKLSPAAVKACALIASKGAFISAISIWEIGLKIKHRQLDIGTSISDYVKRLKKLNMLGIIPVDAEIWVENLGLDWSHKDPVDRTIVATARLKQLPIVTSDAVIREFYPQTIW